MKWYWWVLIALVLLFSWLYMEENNRRTAKIEEIKENIMKGKQFTEADAKTALAKVAAKYGKTVAATIEKVARIETAHFASKQYRDTGTGGMEAFGPAPYYGWFAPFFIANPSYAPVGTTAMLENKGLSSQGGNAQSAKPKVFVIMPSVEAWMMFLADYAERHKANGGMLRWYSTDKNAQALYAQKLAQITPKITNTLA